MNRLAAYRAIEGINQDDLGRLLGVSPQTISAMESGRRNPATVDITVLGYAPERLDTPSMSEPLHRVRASTKAASKKRAKELLRLAGEVFAELSAATPKAPELVLQRFPTPETIDELESAAVEVRCALEHEETGPIRSLTSAVERAGVCLVPISDLPGIDGLSSWVDGVPVIGITPTIPGDRFRFTLAHELGHLLFHARRSDASESEANRFAGALLIPEDEMDAAMPERPQLRDFIALKSSWGMAVSALVYRAHELEYLDDARYRALQIQMSKWRKSEPGRFEPSHGKLLPRLVESNGGTTVVADRLGVNPGHLRAITSWSHLRAL